MTQEKKTKEMTVPIPPAILEGANEILPLEIIAYEVADSNGWGLHPASPKRDWMAVHDNFAYRCLPMTIANQAGWFITCPISFVATWNGNPSKGSIRFDCDEPLMHYMKVITDHFGNGLVTFNVPWLFQVSRPRIGLRVSGIPNSWKFNAGACEGFVAADWVPFTFTMNWKILRPQIPVQFVKGEPICFLQPATLDLVSVTTPVIKSINENPELRNSFAMWDRARAEFNANPKRTNEEWQRFYHGKNTILNPPATHKTNLTVKPFTKSNGKPKPEDMVLVAPPKPEVEE